MVNTVKKRKKRRKNFFFNNKLQKKKEIKIKNSWIETDQAVALVWVFKDPGFCSFFKTEDVVVVVDALFIYFELLLNLIGVDVMGSNNELKLVRPEL